MKRRDFIEWFNKVEIDVGFVEFAFLNSRRLEKEYKKLYLRSQLARMSFSIQVEQLSNMFNLDFINGKFVPREETEQIGEEK